LLDLMTDKRLSLSPGEAMQLPATMVLALGDALSLQDHATRKANEEATKK